MLRLIIERELRDIVGDVKFIFSFAVCSILILLAFYSGAKNHQVMVSRYEASKRENIRQMEGITDWRMVRQTRIFLPPQPLASLVTGISNDIGSNVVIQGRGELSLEDSRYGDDPIFAVFRFLDLDFIFQIVLTLFAILFAYDAISGEKERGTLRLTFSNGVRRLTYLLGKIFGSFFGLVLPLLIPFLLGTIIFTSVGIHLSGDEWLRLCLIIFSGLLLFGAFLTLSVFVSSLTQRSSSSFLILLVAWVFTVMVMPRISALVVGRVVDVPSTEYLASLKGRFGAQLSTENRNLIANYRSTEQSDMQKMMGEFQKYMNDLSEDREKKMRDYSGKLNEDRSNKLEQQTSLSLGVARVSPVATFSLAASTLAGTALSLKETFLKQAEAYQKTFANFMVEKTGMNLGGGMVMMIVNEGSEKPKPIDPAELPSFQFNPPRTVELLKSLIPEWGILILGMLVFFGGSFIAFQRYDVR